MCIDITFQWLWCLFTHEMDMLNSHLIYIMRCMSERGSIKTHLLLQTVSTGFTTCQTYLPGKKITLIDYLIINWKSDRTEILELLWTCLTDLYCWVCQEMTPVYPASGRTRGSDLVQPWSLHTHTWARGNIQTNTQTHKNWAWTLIMKLIWTYKQVINGHGHCHKHF